MKIKKFQLLRWREKRAVADLSGEDFITIGKASFAHHARLEGVVLPASLTAVKASAFKKCRRLKSVMLLGDGNVGISDEAFSECIRLSELTPFGRVFSIGRRAFYRCQKLPSPTLGSDLRKIGEEAFRGCVSIERVTLPAELREVGRGAFADCTELAELNMEEGFSRLSPRAFSNCISLRDIQFSENIVTVPAKCFQNCSALTELHLPCGVQTVGRAAFCGCTSLERVEAEHGLTHVGARAFSDIPQLQSISLPSTVKRLGFAAFGLGKCEVKAVMYVENEYMCRRMRRQLFLCGSSGRVRVVLSGMTIEERKRSRRRATLEQTPVHIFDGQEGNQQQSASEQVSD